VQSIEDATGRLSNLVRLMDEHSKIMQPSDLTVQSYESQSCISNQHGNMGASRTPKDFEDKRAFQRASHVGLHDEIIRNSFKRKSDFLERSQTVIEDLMKDEDHKISQQLDDLRQVPFARQFHRATQANQSAPRARKQQLSVNLAPQTDAQQAKLINRRHAP